MNRWEDSEHYWMKLDQYCWWLIMLYCKTKNQWILPTVCCILYSYAVCPIILWKFRWEYSTDAYNFFWAVSLDNSQLGDDPNIFLSSLFYLTSYNSFHYPKNHENLSSDWNWSILINFINDRKRIRLIQDFEFYNKWKKLISHKQIALAENNIIA